MAKVKLAVPLVGQTTTMSCWYAAVQMVCFYREAGPRLGLPKRYVENTGMYQEDLVQLAKTEGLKAAPIHNGYYTADTICQMLNWVGPLWCAGGFSDGNGHVIVLTGIDGETVYANDPDGPKKRTGTVGWFNNTLWWQWKTPVLYKPQNVAIGPIPAP